MEVQEVQCDVQCDVYAEEGPPKIDAFPPISPMFIKVEPSDDDNPEGGDFVEECCCYYCGLVSFSKNELIVHLQLEHVSEFEDSALREGKGSEKERARNGKRQRAFQCPACSFKTRHKRLFLRHGANHAEMSSGENYGASLGLLAARLHGDEAPLVGIELAAHELSDLTKHGKMGQQKAEYGYTQFDYTYSYLGTRSLKATTLKRLSKRALAHSDEKPYACDTCDYRSIRLGDLVVHRRCHTGEKPYGCHLCEYRGSTSSHLAKHHRVHHSSGRELDCGLCPFRGANRRQASAHRRTHAQRTVYPCPKCSFKATTKGQLTNHLKVHVKNEDPQEVAPEVSNVCLPEKEESLANFPEAPAVEATPHPNTVFVSVNDEGTSVTATDESEEQAISQDPMISPIHIKVEPSLEEYYDNYNENALDSDPIKVGTNVKGNGKPRKKLQFFCEYCGFGARYRRSFVGHIKRHHQSLLTEASEVLGKFTCNLCVYSCSSKAELSAHKESHVSHLVAKAASILTHLACDQCKFVGANKSKLEAHKRKHTGEKPFSCDRCDYKGSTRSGLTVHQKMHLAKKPFICEVCGYATVNRTRLRRHMWVHNGEKPFTCDECGYKCDRLSYLEVHRRVHSGLRPFTCSMCDYKAISKAQIGAHEKLHKSASILTCELCGYKVAGERLLAMHRKTHDRLDSSSSFNSPNKNLLACGMCEFTTSTVQNLRRHRANHTGLKPYACPLCDYRASDKHYLEAHRVVHTGTRPFSCDQCQYTTSYKSCLAEHVLRHTNQTPFICDTCDYRTCHRSALRRHKMKQHPEEENDEELACEPGILNN